MFVFLPWIDSSTTLIKDKPPSCPFSAARGQQLLICCTFLSISLPPVSFFCLCALIFLHYFEDEKPSVCQHSCFWRSQLRRRIPVWSLSHISANASRSDHLDSLPSVFIFIAPLVAACYKQIHTISVCAACCHDPQKTASCRPAAAVQRFDWRVSLAEAPSVQPQRVKRWIISNVGFADKHWTPVLRCFCLLMQGEWGPEGPAEEVCGRRADAEERRKPRQRR